MPLPAEALARLAAPLRTAPLTHIELRSSHSLPVPTVAWTAHTAALVAAANDLANTTPSPTDGYQRCQDEVEVTVRHATHALSHLFALQPFAPFDHGAGGRLRDLVQRRLAVVAAEVECGNEVAPDVDLIEEAEAWRAPCGSGNIKAALREAFAMTEAPVDDTGQFRPEWVLAHYAYRGHELLRHLLPHLASLGLPGLTDMLAAVTLVGEVLTSPDPIAAYVAMDALISADLCADPDIRASVREHLTRLEPALQRARSAAARSSKTIRDSDNDTEIRANALADAYKRLVEGPFRQFAWARHCLNDGAWDNPPMLASLRERLVAAGGSLGAVTADVVIPDLRNGEAHETLIWDGFQELFLTEGVEISPHMVVRSTHLAQSFVAGSEAGLAALRFLDLPADAPVLPEHNEVGRMPIARRVQAFFGTNRLHLLEANLNTRNASLRVERLGLTDVNPCFQALVLAHRLMPNIESFSVTDEARRVTLTVSADGLNASLRPWEFAVSTLDQIPLSTFLPANLDARRRVEDDRTALRSVAWIAVDDAVGIIDGSPDDWLQSDRQLIDARLRVVELAVDRTEALAGDAIPRLNSVASSVAALRQWVVADHPVRAHLADQRAEMRRLRLQWERWGPVLRHPLVSDADLRAPDERQPRLQQIPRNLPYRTL